MDADLNPNREWIRLRRDKLRIDTKWGDTLERASLARPWCAETTIIQISCRSELYSAGEVHSLVGPEGRLVRVAA